MSNDINEKEQPEKKHSLEVFEQNLQNKIKEDLNKNELKSLNEKIESIEKKNSVLENELKSVNKVKNLGSNNMEQKSESRIKVEEDVINSMKLRTSAHLDIKKSDFEKKATTGRMDVDTLGGYLFRPSYEAPIDKTIKSNLRKLLDQINVVSVPYETGSRVHNEILYSKNYRSAIQRRSILEPSDQRDLSVLFQKAQITTEMYKIKTFGQRQYFNNSIVNGLDLEMENIYDNFEYVLAYDILIGSNTHKNIEPIIPKLIAESRTIQTASSGVAKMSDLLGMIKLIPDAVLQSGTSLIIQTSAFIDIVYQETSLEQYKNLDLFSKQEFKMILNSIPVVFVDSTDWPAVAGGVIAVIGNLKDSYKLYRSNGGSMVLNHPFDQMNNDRIDVMYEENVGGGFLVPEKSYGLTLKA